MKKVFFNELTTMSRYICVLIVVFTMNGGQIFAQYANFGNVKVSLEVGESEDLFNRIAILGQLAEKLCKELNYPDTVFLDFYQHLSYRCEPDFFISYDKGETVYTGKDTIFKRYEVNGYEVTSKELMEEDAIVIRQVANQFKAQSTLKAVEYAILNLNQIKSTQAQIEYDRKGFIINSIDTLLIKKMVNTPNSDLINNLLEQKIYKPDKYVFCGFSYSCGLSYYCQNNRYYLFHKDFSDGMETVIIDMENIYEMMPSRINISPIPVIFDSDSSFYYVDIYGDFSVIVDSAGHQRKCPRISQRHVIEDKKAKNSPFLVTYIGLDKRAIIYNLAEEKEDGTYEKTLIYLTKEDRLIQDLDERLK